MNNTTKLTEIMQDTISNSAANAEDKAHVE